MTEQLIYNSQALNKLPDAAEWFQHAATELAEALPDYCDDELTLLLSIASGNLPAIFGIHQVATQGEKADLGTSTVFTVGPLLPTHLKSYNTIVEELTSQIWFDESHTFHAHICRAQRLAQGSSDPLIVYRLIQPKLSEWTNS